MSDLTIIRTFLNRHEAEMAQGLLNESGITSIILADDAGGYRPHLSLSMGNVKLLVKKDDFDNAKAILKVLDSNVED